MKSSSYLNWFRRLVVLGAVAAAGAFASTAGAVGRPPDIQDIATANLAANVSRPPDIGDVASRLSASAPDVFERNSTIISRPPDVEDTAAQVNAALPLVSRPPDVTDTALTLQSSSSSQLNGFNWSDWAIGIGTGMGLALLLGFVFLISRQLRHRVQPA